MSLSGVPSISSRVVPTSGDDDPPSFHRDLDISRIESLVPTRTSIGAPVDDEVTPPLSPLNTFRSTETVGLGEDESELHTSRVRDHMTDAGAPRMPVGYVRGFGLPPISSKVAHRSPHAAPFGSSSVDGGRDIPRDRWQGELDPPNTSVLSAARIPALPTRSSVEDAGDATMGVQGISSDTCSALKKGSISIISGLNAPVEGLEATIGQKAREEGADNDVGGADGGRGDERTTSSPLSPSQYLHLKAVLSLSQRLRAGKTISYAEEHNEDISAEINALSKVRYGIRQLMVCVYSIMLQTSVKDEKRSIDNTKKCRTTSNHI